MTQTHVPRLGPTGASHPSSPGRRPAAVPGMPPRPIIRNTGLLAFPLPKHKRDARRSVYFVPSDDAGCGWLRCLLPALGLSECTDWYADGAWGLRYDMRQVKDFDVVVFQRQGSGPALRNMRECKARGQVVVYEIDDWVLSSPNSDDPTNPFRDRTAGREFILACMRTADLVTVTTTRLAETYSRYNHHLAVLPNCTHPDVNCPSRDTYGHGSRVTVAYAAALAHGADAALLRTVIPAIHANRKEADFLFFGDFPKGEWVADLPNTYRMEFLPIRAYYHALQLFDVGLAPLCTNTFTLHKSNLKALDYLGAGVAPVLQDHPIYAEFKHGRDCLKAKTPADWIHCIRLLIDSPSLRDELVRHGHRWVKHYDYRAHAQAWSQAFEAALQRKGKR